MQGVYPATVVHAIDSHRGITTRGFTFTGSDGVEDFYSFDRLRAEAIKRAHHLRKLGLKKGDRMAMVIPDGVDFVPTFIAALWAGIVPVPLYPPLSLGKLDSYLDTLVSIMRKAEPTVLCTSAKVKPILWSVVGKIPSLQHVISADELAADVPDADQTPETVNGEDTAFLQFTSGSTSAPKGVVVTHASLRANAWAIMHDGLKMMPDDVGVSWLPLYHDMGLIGFVLSPLFHQTQIVFLPTLSFVKSAAIWMETIHKKRASVTFAPNFAYALITKRAKPEMLARWDLSRMRAWGCGAEPINPEVMRTFVKTFAPCGVKPESMLPSYGMAEATLAITFIGLDEPLSTDTIDADAYQTDRRATPAKAADKKQALELVSCGRPFPGHELAIFDEKDRPLGERQIGQVVLRGPSVAAGYFRDAETTAKTLAGGWLHTGDLGYLANGELYIAGRMKDLIIVNGRNYDPQRIEWIVDEMPGVRKGSAVAFSRPGSTSEELIVVAESREQDLEAVKTAIRQRVNEQMQLNAADVVLVGPGTLPKTSSGKLQRQKTRQQYLDGTIGTEGVRTLGSAAQRIKLAKHLTLSLVGRGRHVARGILRVTVEGVRESQNTLVGRTVARLLRSTQRPEDRN